jgi:hypothetical protein
MDWTLVYFELDEQNAGYLLENEDGICSYDREGKKRVPMFRTEKGARMFAKQRAPKATPEVGDEHVLGPLIAFVTGKEELPPDDAHDTWVLLDEIAYAAGREEATASPHHGLAARALETDDPSDEELVALRAALLEALTVASEAIILLDVPAGT